MPTLQNSQPNSTKFTKIFLKIDITIFIFLILALLVYYFSLFSSDVDWMASLGNLLKVGQFYAFSILPYTIISYIVHIFLNLKTKNYTFLKQRLVLLLIHLLIGLYILVESYSPEMVYIFTFIVFTLTISPLILSIYQLFQKNY
jgi:hypothetical protein